MPDPHQPDAALREELVAYLDGELPPEEARAVEERLSRDERYRREMQGFDRAWNALEELPQVSVDDSFTKTTIEMVAVAAEKDLAQLTQSLPTVRRKRTLWVAGIAAVAALLGFALARITLDRPDRVLIANLPVVQQLDAYNQNLSREFLTALQKDAKDLLEPYQDEELELQLKSLREMDAESSSERRARVEQMSDGEKAALRANYIRFVELPEEKREQLNALHTQLQTDESLLRTTLAYWAWLQDRRNGGADQAELRQASSTNDRLELMRKLDRGRSRQISLSPAEAKGLRDVAKSLMERQDIRDAIQQLLAERPTVSEPDQRSGRNRFRNSAGSLFALYWSAQRQTDKPHLKPLWERSQQQMLEQLTPENRAVVERDPQVGAMLLRLVGEAMWQGRRPSEEELEQFFASRDISADRVQQLLDMPRDQMLRELTSDYFRVQFGSEGPWGGRDGRRGDRDDRGRDDRRGGRDGFGDRDRRPDGPGRPGGPNGPRFGGPDDGPPDFRPDGRERRRPGPPPDGEGPFGQLPFEGQEPQLPPSRPE